MLRHVRHQLGLALELHASSDAAWLADLEARHARQVGALRAHEAKCTRLYDGRLREYPERAAAQLEGAQDALLDGRGAAAAERARLESRVWRLKAQCARWRADLMAARERPRGGRRDRGRYAAVVASQADELRARAASCAPPPPGSASATARSSRHAPACGGRGRARAREQPERDTDDDRH